MVKKNTVFPRESGVFFVFLQDVTHVNPQFCKNGAYVNYKMMEFVCII